MSLGLVLPIKLYPPRKNNAAHNSICMGQTIPTLRTSSGIWRMGIPNNGPCVDSFPCSMVTDRAKIRLGPLSFWSLSNSSFSQTKVDDYSNLRKDVSFCVKPGFGCCSIALTSYVEVSKACSIYGWGLLPSKSSGFSPFSSHFCEWHIPYTPFPDTPKSVLEFQSTSQFPSRSTKTHGES